MEVAGGENVRRSRHSVHLAPESMSGVARIAKRGRALKSSREIFRKILILIKCIFCFSGLGVFCVYLPIVR